MGSAEREKERGEGSGKLGRDQTSSEETELFCRGAFALHVRNGKLRPLAKNRIAERLTPANQLTTPNYSPKAPSRPIWGGDRNYIHQKKEKGGLTICKEGGRPCYAWGCGGRRSSRTLCCEQATQPEVRVLGGTASRKEGWDQNREITAIRCVVRGHHERLVTNREAAGFSRKFEKGEGRSKY